MSELNFNVLGNNADLQKESQLLHEAISGLESDFKDLHASAEDSITGIEQLISDLRTQIDSTIATLNVMKMENQMWLEDPSQRISLSAVFEY